MFTVLILFKLKFLHCQTQIIYHISIPKILAFAIHLPFGLFTAKLACLTISLIHITLR